MFVSYQRKNIKRAPTTTWTGEQLRLMVPHCGMPFRQWSYKKSRVSHCSSPSSKCIQVQETCRCGKRISYSSACLSQSKDVVVRLLEVSSWSIRGNYDSLSYQLSVIHLVLYKLAHHSAVLMNVLVCKHIIVIN